ncbi:hypothetical protein HYV31_01025 [candidate division WWE3 bacterium]|nr:hypothetical protein [candidate division WWE3 bacterium]
MIRKSQLEVLEKVKSQTSNSGDREYDETEVSRGIIKKEIIPKELELGDYWYWIYFDEPYLLKDNASGFPRYVSKIQVSPSQNIAKDFDEMVNIPVEIFSRKSWGYAESNLFEILAITKL